jgi:hypothetical protein
VHPESEQGLVADPKAQSWPVAPSRGWRRDIESSSLAFKRLKAKYDYLVTARCWSASDAASKHIIHPGNLECRPKGTRPRIFEKRHGRDRLWVPDALAKVEQIWLKEFAPQKSR